MTDEQLLRESLTSLSRCLHIIEMAADKIAPEYRGKWNVYDEVTDLARATTAKLEERLLTR